MGQPRTPCVGIDFGTSNSALALADAAGDVSFLEFSLLGAMTQSYRTLLFFDPDEQEVRLPIQFHAGVEAIEAYLEAMGEGRLVQSFKTHLTTLSLGRTNAFFMGGGKGLVNAYYRTADRLGIDVLYEAPVTHLELDGDRITRVDYSHQGRDISIAPKSVIVASGGFQADTDWLTRAWGPAARNFLIRGTPYNRGVVLADLLGQGVESVGDADQCHAVAIDGRAPKFDGGIVTRLDCVPFSIVVNKHGARFYDEGEDVWPKRYAIWGRLIAAQPDQVGYVIIDAKSLNLFMPSVFPPLTSDTLDGLAAQMGVPADALCETVAQFNAACGDTAGFHPTELDGVATTGLTPPKTNWARPITEPPFYGYSLRTGVTFTYLGLKVDETARCRTANGPVQNLWAAGEVMAGSILGQGYLAGFGMTIGTVFGRIAGREAAAHAH